MTNERDSAKQWSSILALCVVVLNVVFFFLSSRYYADRAAQYGPADYSNAMLTHTRITFAVFTISVAAIGSAAAFFPWLAAFGLSGAAAALAAVAGVGAFAKGLHPILCATLLAFAAVFAVLTAYALSTRSRAAWSFLVALNWVGVLTTLFGATKIRNALGTNLWLAMIVPGVFAVAALSLMAVRQAFDDSEPVTPVGAAPKSA